MGDDLGSLRARGTVQAASVDTNEPRRDAHLRSADLFDGDHNAQIMFQSTRTEPLDEESFRIAGAPTMHGVTNELVLFARVHGADLGPWGNERVGLEVSGQPSRGDHGMKFNQALGSANMLVSDRLTLTLDVSTVRHAS